MSETVVITGASAGIGEALAQVYSQKGYRVVLLARRLDRLQAIAKALPGPSLTLECDVGKDGDLQRVAQEIQGPIHTVIANAGFAVSGRVERLSIEDYHRQFQTNVYGVIRTFQAFLPALRATKGRLGVVGSVNSHIALPKHSAYCMSKFAVRALCDSLRGEVARDGISVTLLCPGFVESEIRKVDNLGVYQSQNKDPVPPWIQAPPEAAASQIYRALQARRAEVPITFHARVLLWIQRYFVGLTRIIAQRVS